MNVLPMVVSVVDAIAAVASIRESVAGASRSITESRPVSDAGPISSS